MVAIFVVLLLHMGNLCSFRIDSENRCEKVSISVNFTLTTLLSNITINTIEF